MNKFQKYSCLILIFVLLLGSSNSMAQTQKSTLNLHLPAERITASPYLRDALSFVIEPEAEKIFRLDLAIGIHYSERPYRLYLIDNPDWKQTPISYRFRFSPSLSIAFRKWAEIGIVIPFVKQGVEDEDIIVNVEKASGTFLADPEFHLKIPFFHNRPAGIGLGFAGNIKFPVGGDEIFVDENTWRGDTLLLMDWQKYNFVIGMNIGVLWRESFNRLDTEFSHEMIIRPAIAYRIPVNKKHQVTIGLEGHFSGRLDNFFSKENIDAQQIILSVNIQPMNFVRGFSGMLGVSSAETGDDGGYGVGKTQTFARVGYSFALENEPCPRFEPKIEVDRCMDLPFYDFSVTSKDQYPENIEWDINGTKISQARLNQLHLPPGKSEVSVSLYYKFDGHICTYTDETILDVPDKEFNFTEIHCSPSISKAPASIKCEVTSNSYAKQIEWQFGDGSHVVKSNSLNKSLHYYSDAGQYYVTASAKVCGESVSITTENPIVVEGVRQPQFVTSISFPFGTPRHLAGKPFKYIDKPSEPALLPPAIKSLALHRNIFTALLASPRIVIRVVGKISSCSESNASSGSLEDNNIRMAQRRADAVRDAIIDMVGGSASISTASITTELHDIDTKLKCQCSARNTPTCANERSVEIYYDIAPKLQ